MPTRLRHVLLFLLLVASPVVADEIPRSALGARAVRFTYTASFSAPAESEVVELWLPLPREDDQVIRDLRLTGSGHPKIVVLHPSGDRVAYLRIERPGGGPVALT